MSQVSLLTVDEIVEKALNRAPEEIQEPVKTASPKGNLIFAIADKLEKLASEVESKKAEDVAEFKVNQAEKRAALTQIVRTYLELESSR